MDFDKTKLSNNMQEELKKYEASGEDGIYLLVSNNNYTTDEIINRIQASKIEDIFSTSLKTTAQWKTFSSSLGEVKNSIAPILDDKFSSYALKEDESAYGHLRYPLCSSFSSKKILFSKKTFPNYNNLLTRIKDVYKVKIVEKNINGQLFTYKRENKFKAIIKNFGYGVLNLCRKMFKKQKLSTAKSYRGKIIINSNLSFGNQNNYKISQQEKFTKILDSIIAVTTKNVAKKKKSTLTEKQLFFSRLYADVLLSRAIDYGDLDTNKKIEDSLTLQMSNVLAGLDMTAEEIKEASSIGYNVALITIKSLGLSLNQIKASVKNAGYVYDEEPTSIEEALLPKYKKLTKGNEPVKNEIKDEEYSFQNVNLHDGSFNFNLENKGEKVIYTFPVGDDEIIVTEGKKISDKKEELNKGIKSTKIFLTKNSAKKYIDRVIESNLKKQINKAIGTIAGDNLSEKRVEKEKRKYNFFEHMLSFYNLHKELDEKKLEEMELNELLLEEEVADNNYAHSLGKSFIDFRQEIINEIFNGKDSIEKVDDKSIISIINEKIEAKFGKRLSSYVSSLFNTKNMNSLFKEIDGHHFDPIDISVKEIQKN